MNILLILLNLFITVCFMSNPLSHRNSGKYTDNVSSDLSWDRLIVVHSHFQWFYRICVCSQTSHKDPVKTREITMWCVMCRVQFHKLANDLSFSWQFPWTNSTNKSNKNKKKKKKKKNSLIYSCCIACWEPSSYICTVETQYDAVCLQYISENAVRYKRSPTEKLLWKSCIY